MRAQSHMRVPEAVVDREDRLAAVGADPVEDEPRRVTQLRNLREVPYAELIAVDAFIDGHTPFATKHGVKGAEFEKDRKSVVEGKCVSVRVDLGGCRIIKKKNKFYVFLMLAS